LAASLEASEAGGSAPGDEAGVLSSLLPGAGSEARRAHQLALRMRLEDAFNLYDAPPEADGG
jgi:hypothetical protein